MKKFKFLNIAVILTLSACAIKPKPLSQAELQRLTRQDMAKLHLARPKIKARRLNLNRAVARSIKYNLEARLKAFEYLLANTDLQATTLTMLPEMAVNAGYVKRSNINEILSPVTGLVSTAEDRQRRLRDLQFKWHVLDFGLSYYLSKQKADEAMIAYETRRKVMLQLAKDTREQFWLAYALQHYLDIAPRFHASLRQAVSQSRSAQNEKLIEPIEGARNRRELWETASAIQNIKARLASAKPQLMNLIQAPDRQKRIRLQTNRLENRAWPRGLSLNIKKLQKVALLNRAELRQEHYQKRITLNEIKQAHLKLLPNVSLGLGLFNDSNSFLVNNTWRSSTMDLAWDLLTLPNKFKNVEIASHNATIADLRRLGLALTILTQVEIAHRAYFEAKELLYYYAKVHQSDKEIYRVMLKKKQIKFATKLALARAYTKKIESKLIYDKAYAEYQIAAATLLTSIGYDPVLHVSTLNRPIKLIMADIKGRQLKMYQRELYRPRKNLPTKLAKKPIRRKIKVQAKPQKVALKSTQSTKKTLLYSLKQRFLSLIGRT